MKGDSIPPTSAPTLRIAVAATANHYHQRRALAFNGNALHASRELSAANSVLKRKPKRVPDLPALVVKDNTSILILIL
jgi:hypothetical protein